MSVKERVFDKRARLEKIASPGNTDTTGPEKAAAQQTLAEMQKWDRDLERVEKDILAGNITDEAQMRASPHWHAPLP